MKRHLLALALATTLIGAAVAQQSTRPLAPEAKPAVSWVGAHSKVLQRGFERIRTQDAWEDLWYKHTGESSKLKDATYAFPPRIDFSRFEVIAFFRGPATNINGEDVVSLDDAGTSLLLRFDSMSYQTASFDGKDSGQKCEPFGLWVIDRTAKAIIIEENVQGLIGQPPKWKEQHRFEAAK